MYNFGNCRYGYLLIEVLNEIGGEKELRELFENGYQGYVDIDVLLSDGRIFTYKYSYGSCSDCDEWDYRGLTDEEIKDDMRSGATYFDNMEEYEKWRESVGSKNNIRI